MSNKRYPARLAVAMSQCYQVPLHIVRVWIDAHREQGHPLTHEVRQTFRLRHRIANEPIHPEGA